MSRLDRLRLEDYALDAADRDRILSPALVVHLDKVRSNLDAMIALCGGDPGRWRPHLKTAKIPRVFAEYVRHGVRHFKCATLREARHLIETFDAEGVEDGDVLVAYPLIGPALEALADLVSTAGPTRLSILAEDPAVVPAVPASCGIFVDLNPGMNRTGLPMDDLEGIHAVAAAAGNRFRGVHHYDGHLRQPDPETRHAAAIAGYERLLETIASLQSAGRAVGEVVTSGTPAFPAALGWSGFREAGLVHRVSPGTVVYHDMTYDEVVPEIELTPAAVVMSRVISHPADGMATLDAGSKSVAAEAGHPCVHVIGHPELVARKPSEEHLPLDVTSGERPPRGEVLYLVPRHVCPTVNLAEEAVLVEGGRIVDVVPVSARAHDTMRSAGPWPAGDPAAGRRRAPGPSA